MELGQISTRGADQIVRVAWTLADIATKDRPELTRSASRSDYGSHADWARAGTCQSGCRHGVGAHHD
jgi:hypothetical protein